MSKSLSAWCSGGLVLGTVMFLFVSACAGPTPASESVNQTNSKPVVDGEKPIGEEPVANENDSITYQIEGEVVTEKEFTSLLQTLEVEPEPFVTASLENMDSSYGGWEATTNAKDPKTGQAYRLSETQMGDFHSKGLTRVVR